MPQDFFHHPINIVIRRYFLPFQVKTFNKTPGISLVLRTLKGYKFILVFNFKCGAKLGVQGMKEPVALHKSVNTGKRKQQG